jgi:magnesium-transporting ATPase (P-type)
MATFTQRDGTLIASVTGAPGRVLELSVRIRRHGQDAPLDDARRRELIAVNHQLAAGGLRVLALATGRVASPVKASCAI